MPRVARPTASLTWLVLYGPFVSAVSDLCVK